MSDTKAKIIDDLTGLLSGLGVAAQGVREEVEQLIQARLEAIMRAGDFVTREEFEVVRDMAMTAREENTALRTEINALKKTKKTNKAK